MFTTLLAVHVLALGALLLVARHDVVLVDEAGQPVDRHPGWHEQVVPEATAAEAPALR